MGRGVTVATIRLKYVQSFIDRNGHPRFYFRRSGRREALPGLPGSAEFMDAYAACLAGAPLPAVRKAAAGQGTFNALAAAYYGSTNYLALAQSSRRAYRRVIDHFLTEHGHRLVSDIKRANVVSLIGKMADRPSAAAILLKRIRTLVRFAIDMGWLAIDPTLKVRTIRPNEIHTWTEDEIAQFEARWQPGTKQRLGFALHLYTGQRGSDVHRMAWPDVAGSVIHVAQQKTKAKLAITLHARLAEILAVASKKHVAIITTEYNKPFSAKGFGQFMSAAVRAAGLPVRCKVHGLRKAAARRLAEAGCTANEIAAVTGHKTLAEIERYTRAADQEQLGRQAIEKQSGNARVNSGLKAVSTRAEKAQK